MANDANDKKIRSEDKCFIFTLNPNAHIPGYTGHCPFLRDTFGETFSASTWAAYIIRRSQLPLSARQPTPTKTLKQNYHKQIANLPLDGVQLTTVNTVNNDNDHFRSTLDTNYQVPNATRVSSPVQRVDKLNRFQNLYLWSNNNVDKCSCGRLFLSTPAIGYGGHIPRLQVTSAGIGLRFTEAARISLALFQRELEQTKAKWSHASYSDVTPEVQMQNNSNDDIYAKKSLTV